MVDDPTINVEDFAKHYLANESNKTARKIIQQQIPHQKISGRIFLKKSAADAWRDSNTMTPATPDFDSMLRELSGKALARVLARRVKADS